MNNTITVYDAKFCMYSALNVIEDLWIHLETDQVTDQDIRRLSLTKEQMQEALSSDWDLTKV